MAKNTKSNLFAVLSVATVLLVCRQAALAAGKVLQLSDLIYEGAFRVPPGTSDMTTFAYGGTAMAYNPANNSLFLVGHDWHQRSAEISIPAIINSTNINSLQTATILQTFTDATGGKLNSINPDDPNSKKVGGQLVFNGKLILSAYSYYDGNGDQSASHFARPLSLSVSGQVQGPFRVGNQYPGFVSGYMTLIPPEWQAGFGGPALTGNCCLAIVGVQSNGPAASVFNPDNIGVTSPVPAVPVVGYPVDQALGDWGTGNPNFNGTTSITGIVFPRGSQTVLFFGRHGTGPFCYGTGTNNQSLEGQPTGDGSHYCYDPANSSKGTHGYPYAYQVWAYDAQDLVNVKNDAHDHNEEEERRLGLDYLHQWEIRPYGIWAFTMPFSSSGDMHNIGGAAYDPQTQKIYISQQCRDSGCSPIIQVFRVNAAPATPDSEPPARPKGLRIR